MAAENNTHEITHVPNHEYDLRSAIAASQARARIVRGKYGFRAALRYHYLYGKHHPHDENYPITDWNKVKP